MNPKYFLKAVGLLVLALSLVLAGCEGDAGPAGPAGVAGVPGAEGTASCIECHDDSNLITGKEIQWAESAHGTGEAYVRGTSSSCAGCHSGNAFADMVNAGLNPSEVTEGDTDPTRQDCRACHLIHDTYDSADFALRTVDPVDFYAIPGTTFDGGMGNLCVNCHQPRRVMAEPVEGIVSGINSHWGPHHGPQSAMMMGVAGEGVTGSPSSHYTDTRMENSCYTCHMGDDANHTFEVDDNRCQSCHDGLNGFDYNGVQTEIKDLANVLGDLLVTAGLIDENSEDGHAIVSSAPTPQATALWNWIYVVHEDKSFGVHNSDYARDLLQVGIDNLQPAP
ncbi:MAG: hypothetical protein ACI9UK_001441 [Candidatus Krumholzibacteriia bacterium]|jgi:formate-dependent nitrite reductase cytochrome c552 subunit